MKIAVLLFFSLFLYASCSNGKLDYRAGCSDYPSFGWIEDEEAKGVYLINTSKSKKITFTVRTTIFSQWKPYGSPELYPYQSENTTETDTYTLNPGEEEYLTCTVIVQSKDKKTITRYKFKIVGEFVEAE